MRSAVAKSRDWRAAWRSATSFSTSASPDAAAFLSVAEGLQFLGVVVFENGKNLIEGLQQVLRGGGVGLAKFAFVHGDVGFAHEFEDRSEGARGVEVVGEAGVEFSRLPRRCARPYFSACRREIFPAPGGRRNF